MKKIISLLLTLSLSASLLLTCAAGAYNKKQLDQADALNHLGLFLGTGQGYELDARLDRSQSITLILRILGEIAEAEKEIAEKTDDGEEYGIDEQLAEQERNDAILAEAEDKLNRSVAYTQLMLTRVYKAFWVEKVSICDNTDELRADLEEFYEKLSSGEAGSEE